MRSVVVPSVPDGWFRKLSQSESATPESIPPNLSKMITDNGLFVQNGLKPGNIKYILCLN